MTQRHVRERTADVVIAAGSGQPDGGASLLGRTAQDPRDCHRWVLGVDRLGHHTGRGEGGPLRVILITGEDDPFAQHLPGLPGQRAGRDPRAGDEQDETHRAQDDELGAGLLRPVLSDGATTFAAVASHRP
jgi:hypothetical protein